MKTLTFIIVASIFSLNAVFAQDTKANAKTKEEARQEAFEKPIRMMVQWMADNLDLSAEQEKELLNFYLNTPIYFSSVDSEASSQGKEESFAKQEAKLKEVLTPQQLEEFLSRRDEVQDVLMQNLPGK